MGGYGLFASPTLYPGQSLRASVEADAKNASPVLVRPFIVELILSVVDHLVIELLVVQFVRSNIHNIGFSHLKFNLGNFGSSKQAHASSREHVGARLPARATSALLACR